MPKKTKEWDFVKDYEAINDDEKDTDIKEVTHRLVNPARFTWLGNLWSSVYVQFRHFLQGFMSK